MAGAQGNGDAATAADGLMDSHTGDIEPCMEPWRFLADEEVPLRRSDTRLKLGLPQPCLVIANWQAVRPYDRCVIIVDCCHKGLRLSTQNHNSFTL